MGDEVAGRGSQDADAPSGSFRPNGNTVARVHRLAKEFQLEQERSNLRALIPGPLGEPTGAGRFLAVDDVSFEVTAGESLGIVGDNGAGKSTILKILAGVMDPTSGEASIFGDMVALIELGVGFEPNLTGEDNIYFGAGLLGWPRSVTRELHDEIVAFAELEEFLHMPLRRYSTGMKARLGFALATARRPDVLIIDEVLSVGDVGFQLKCVRRLQEMSRAGTSLILVSHNTWTMLQLCDRLLLLERGRVAMEGEPSAVMSRYLRNIELPDPPVLPMETAEEHPTTIPPVFKHVVESLHQRPTATIESLAVIPPAIKPGDPVVLRALLHVEEPTEGLLAMSLVTSDLSVFAERDLGPGEILQRVGRWTIEIHIPTVPISTGRFEFRLAVLTHDEIGPERPFEDAMSVRTAEVQILGPASVRAGLALASTWHVTRADHENDEASA